MSTPWGIPTSPRTRRSSQSQNNSHQGTPLLGGGFRDTSTPPPFVGTPDNIRLLRAQVISGTPPVGLSIPPRDMDIPPRAGTPGSGNGVTGTPASGADVGPSRSRGETPVPTPINLDNLPADEKARILARHLVSDDERQEAESHYAALGADVTHDIYKWHEAHSNSNEGNGPGGVRRVRSATFSGVSAAATSTVEDPAFQHIHEPGGFRRNYVLLKNANNGNGFNADEVAANEPPVVVNNFIDFLFLFGHFAGEDLEEDEELPDDLEDDLEGGHPHPASSTTAPILGFGEVDNFATESSPLLGGSTFASTSALQGVPPTLRSRSRSRLGSRRRAGSTSRALSATPGTGTATVGQAVLMLLKGFVGTGVLFLGKAFFNGGILFSSLLFVFIAAVSLHSFLLLVRAKLVVPGSFGDIGGTLYGPWMRQLILFSIVISQLGFVSAYIIFVSENLQAFVGSVTSCGYFMQVKYLIILQSLIFLPLSLIRDIVKLSTTALIADFFILLGLGYIFSSEISLVATRGALPVQLYNPRDASLFVGTAVFSFEGIGLIVPIVDAMKEPKKFEAVLTGVMLGLVFLFGGAGALAYLTFGKDVQTVVLVNLNELNPGSRMLQIVQFLYSMAILLSVPLQLFPAVRIMENGLFTRSGKADTKVKWMKNLFRFATVILTGFIALVGAKDLDKFVAFVGCFACVPLCYVYPAMLHYRACARTRNQKLGDIAMIVFGLAAAAFTTVQTVKLMIDPSGAPSPVGECGSPTQGLTF